MAEALIEMTVAPHFTLALQGFNVSIPGTIVHEFQRHARAVVRARLLCAEGDETCMTTLPGRESCFLFGEVAFISGEIATLDCFFEYVIRGGRARGNRKRKNQDQ